MANTMIVCGGGCLGPKSGEITCPTNFQSNGITEGVRLERDKLP